MDVCQSTERENLYFCFASSLMNLWHLFDQAADKRFSNCLNCFSNASSSFLFSLFPPWFGTPLPPPPPPRTLAVLVTAGIIVGLGEGADDLVLLLWRMLSPARIAFQWEETTWRRVLLSPPRSCPHQPGGPMRTLSGLLPQTRPIMFVGTYGHAGGTALHFSSLSYT